MDLRTQLTDSDDALAFIFDNDLRPIDTYEYIVEKMEIATHIYRKPDTGEFILVWSDGVANEWAEVYPSLGILLLRLGALIACGETEWSKGFRDDPKAFVQKAEDFLSESIG